MIFGQDRNELRQMYVSAFDKARKNLPLSPLEAQIAAVVEAHPEYHKALRADSLEQDFMPEAGQTNPFLHMGLHLALREQLSTNRPAGIRAEHARIAALCKDPHDAEHRMIECLAETLWEAQSRNLAPDEQQYLKRLQSLLR